MTILSNLLLSAPGYSGFTSYVRRVMPGIPGWRLVLSHKGHANCRTDNKLPTKLPDSWRLSLLQRLSLTQHGVDILSAFSRASIAKESISAVYSPYCDYLYALTGLPQVITCHDLTPLFVPNSRKAYLRYRYLMPMHLNRAARVIAISRFVADQLVDFGIAPAKIEVIYNGIATKGHPISAPKSQDLLMIARHDQNKNVLRVVTVFLNFLDVYPQWSGNLIIVGRDGRQSYELRRTLRSSPNYDRIKLISGVNSVEITQLMRSSMALISASLMEGFDYPILEAKAEGLPTLISDIPVHRELHDQTSLFFDPESSGDQLIEHIKRIDSEKDVWSDLSKAGLRLTSRLSLDFQRSRILEVLSNAINTRPVVRRELCGTPRFGG